MEFNNDEVCKRLIELRKKKGKHQDDIAKIDEFSCQKSAISKIETGKTRISIDQLAALSKYYGLPADYILFGSKEHLSFDFHLTERDLRLIKEDPINVVPIIEKNIFKITYDDKNKHHPVVKALAEMYGMCIRYRELINKIDYLIQKEKK